jgi:hypothetical protein
MSAGHLVCVTAAAWFLVQLPLPVAESFHSIGWPARSDRFSALQDKRFDWWPGQIYC